MKAKRYYFDFKGVCVATNVFEAPLRECAQKNCAPIDVKPTRVLPTGETMLEFALRGEGIRQRYFEFIIRQNCDNSPGLLISDTRRREVRYAALLNNGVHPIAPRVTYDLIPIASAVEIDVCLEEFRTYFHLSMFKCICRCKYSSKVLTRQLDDIERLDLHYDAMKMAVEVNSEAIEAVRAQLAALEQRLQTSEERWASRKKRRTVE